MFTPEERKKMQAEIDDIKFQLSALTCRIKKQNRRQDRRYYLTPEEVMNSDYWSVSRTGQSNGTTSEQDPIEPISIDSIEYDQLPGMSLPSTAQKVTFASDDCPRSQRATMSSSSTSDDHSLFPKPYQTPVSDESITLSPKSSSHSSDTKSIGNKGFASSSDVESDKFSTTIEAEDIPSAQEAYPRSIGLRKEETAINSGKIQRVELGKWLPASTQPKQEMSVPCTSRNVPDRHRVLAVWETVQSKPPA